ncbi:MAG: WG repeat-containing protein [Saprospiraceae bacterium]
MNKFLTLLFIFFLKISFAQEIRIPFRVGDKFGLSNQAGKLIIPATFEEVNPIGNNFFETKTLKIDSVKNSQGEKILNKVLSLGVIHNDLEIIKEAPHSEFRLVFSCEFILGSNSSRELRSTMLYNLEGEKLLPESGGNIFFNDYEHIGTLGKSNPNLILISIIKKGKTSIAVYDRKKEKITKWLIEGVMNFKRHKNLEGKSLAFVTYYDPLPNEKYRYLAYNNVTNDFEIIPLSKKDEAPYIRTYSYLEYEGIMEAPEEEIIEENTSSSNKTYQRYMFIIENESTVRYRKKVLPHLPGTKYLNLRQKQLNPIIYKLNNKVGIISSDISGVEAKYDSLTYMTKYNSFDHDQSQFLYVAGKISSDSLKLNFGIIDQFGNEITPMDFDTIHNFIPRLTYKLKNENGKSITYAVSNENEKHRHLAQQKINMPNEFVFGIKNGQMFLINVMDKKITPYQHDAIFWNKFPDSPPMEITKKIFILKKDNKYGVLDSINPSQKWIDNKIVFPFIPAYSISNYGGKKGFSLFKLINKNGFSCYAREDGFLYYEK